MGMTLTLKVQVCTTFHDCIVKLLLLSLATTPPPNEGYDAVKMVSDLEDSCPKVDLVSEQFHDTTVAVCTEVTYKCLNESHVLVVGDGGVCLNIDKTTRECSSDGYEPAVEPHCSRKHINLPYKSGRHYTHSWLSKSLR